MKKTYKLGDKIGRLQCDDEIQSEHGVSTHCYHSTKWLFCTNGSNPKIKGKLTPFYMEGTQDAAINQLKLIDERLKNLNYV